MSSFCVLKRTDLFRNNRIINIDCCCLVGCILNIQPYDVSCWEGCAVPLLTASFRILQEAIEKKEQRAKRFHFRAEVNLAQRNVALDRDMMKKGRSLPSSEEGKIPLFTSSQFLYLIYTVLFPTSPNVFQEESLYFENDFLNYFVTVLIIFTPYFTDTRKENVFYLIFGSDT